MKAHPYYKLGKKAAKKDGRTLKFASLIETPATLPATFAGNSLVHNIWNEMDGNDQNGDCVIAGRAKMTRNFKYAETGKIPNITTKQILAEYYKETGGPDSGLVILDSLKQWQSNGWKAGAGTLKIKAFAALNRRSPDDFRQAIYAKLGCYIGVELPAVAQRELNAGRGWSTTTGPGSQPGSWGGHAVFVIAYDKTGATCCTWGQLQHMTWAWLAKYCDEAFVVVDIPTNAQARKLLNMTKIDEHLERIAA